MATSNYNKTLNRIASNLSELHVKHLAFLVQAVEKLQPEKFQNGRDLFDKLEESGLISAESPGFLKSLLENIRQVKLAEQVHGPSKVFSADDTTSFQGRVKLYGILNNLDDKDMDQLRFLYKPPRDTAMDDGIDLGIYLVKKQLLNYDFASNLTDINRDDLATIMKQYLSCYITDTEDDGPTISTDGCVASAFARIGRKSRRPDVFPQIGERLKVAVEKCKRQFFKDHRNDSYRMESIPRGLALIVNVNSVRNEEPRLGTNVDRDNLLALLTQLHFTVTIFNDNDGLAAREIETKIKSFSERVEHKTGDASIVCMLSHGIEDHIFGTDGEMVELSKIYSFFNAANCPNLRTKPKIFITQACRGSLTMTGVRTDALGDRIPLNADMLLCYPTEMHYAAFRDENFGSWFIQAIVIIFMKYAKEEDVNTMISRVNGLVSRMVAQSDDEESDGKMQMPDSGSRLTKPLYFFP